MLRIATILDPAALQPQGHLLEMLFEAHRGQHLQLPFLQSTRRDRQGRPEIKSQLLFVDTEESSKHNYQDLIDKNPFRSYVHGNLYPEKQSILLLQLAGCTSHRSRDLASLRAVRRGALVAQPAQKTSVRQPSCAILVILVTCSEVCLDNRRCITAEQPLYSDIELQRHLKEGELSKTGEVLLYHPQCEFCNRRFYDV